MFCAVTNAARLSCRQPGFGALGSSRTGFSPLPPHIRPTSHPLQQQRPFMLKVLVLSSAAVGIMGGPLGFTCGVVAGFGLAALVSKEGSKQEEEERLIPENEALDKTSNDSDEILVVEGENK